MSKDISHDTVLMVRDALCSMPSMQCKNVVFGQHSGNAQRTLFQSVPVIDTPACGFSGACSYRPSSDDYRDGGLLVKVCQIGYP